MIWKLTEKSLDLKVSKAKELCCVCRDGAATTSELFKPLFVQEEQVEQVEFFRYLWTQTDDRLSFLIHSDSIYNKAASLPSQEA